jgi:hypothetical protein
MFSLGVPLYERASECENSLERMALAMIAIIIPMNQTKYRKRKPFNSMVGETFEMVTEDMKFVAEQL